MCRRGEQYGREASGDSSDVKRAKKVKPIPDPPAPSCALPSDYRTACAPSCRYPEPRQSTPRWPFPYSLPHAPLNLQQLTGYAAVQGGQESPQGTLRREPQHHQDYNPMNKGKNSFQPILTFVAETKEYVAGELRDGDRPTGKQIEAHLQMVFASGAEDGENAAVARRFGFLLLGRGGKRTRA
jgi:hypothetical protein